MSGGCQWGARPRFCSISFIFMHFLGKKISQVIGLTPPLSDVPFWEILDPALNYSPKTGILYPESLDPPRFSGDSRISQRGRQLQKEVGQPIISQNFLPKKCIKMKELGGGSQGRAPPLDPPLAKLRIS